MAEKASSLCNSSAQSIAQMLEHDRAGKRRTGQVELAIAQIIEPRILRPEDDLSRAFAAEVLRMRNTDRAERRVPAHVAALAATDLFRNAPADDDIQRGVLVIVRWHGRVGGKAGEAQPGLVEHDGHRDVRGRQAR